MERLGPLGQPGQDLRAADDDLDREQDRGADRQPDQRRVVALGAPGDDGQRRDDRPPTNAATQRWRTWAAVTSVIAGTSDPFISGQSGKTRAEAVAVTCEPNSSSAKVTPRRERGEQGEPLARAATADPRRIAGAHGQEDEQRDQRQRRGEVRGDRLAAVAEPDRLAPEPRLEPDQADRRERRPQDRAPVAVVADRQDGEPQDLEADDDGDGPMDPLDPRLRSRRAAGSAGRGTAASRGSRGPNRWRAR